jgi:chaperonin GroES
MTLAASPPSTPTGRTATPRMTVVEKTPIKMMYDRLLVELDTDAGERRSSAGIVIPATAAMGARRLSWSKVVAVGPNARSVEAGDRVLFDPEDKAEVEVNGEVYVVVRERDVHAVAADRLGDSATGLYL